MPVLRNNYHSNLFLPDGTAIRRGGPDVTMPADKWAKELENPVVQAWVDEGRIVVEGGAPSLKAAEPVRMAADPAPEPAPVDDEADPRDPLRDEARELGIEVDNRWGEKRLREEIAKARD